MIYIGIVFLLVNCWMAFEIWRAPIMEELDNGRLVTKRPAKKLSDLLNKKSKKK